MSPSEPGAPGARLSAVTTERTSSSDRHAAAEKRRKQLRRMQDAGLVLLALGVLVLAYLALTYSPA